MLPFILSLIAAARVFFQSGTDTAVEVLALRRQVAVLKRRRPKPPLRPLDRPFWTFLRATWSRRKDALVIVKPETVVGWHQACFRLYWRWKSRRRDGRPRIKEKIRVLIRRLAQENSDWGAPQDPWRVAEARLRALRKDRGVLFAEPPVGIPVETDHRSALNPITIPF